MPRRSRCSSATASLTREAVAAEGVDGGFSAVYPILRALEEAGRIRRGYFVDGLGAAQFALPGAIDRLRAVREPAERRPSDRVHLLAAADPANPYGAALAWPRRGDDDRRPLQRAAGRVRRAGRRGRGALPRAGRRHRSRPLPAADDPEVADAAARGRSARLVADGRVRELVITQGRRRCRSAESPCARTRLARGAGLRRPAIAGSVRAGRRRRSTADARGRHAPPDRGRAAAVPRRPDRDRRRARPTGAGPAGRAARRARRSTGVEALGKNLLIRFDNGLELRTHLRMNGSWHRYRPGERWRRPPARARLVLEVPGAVAVCFDAPVVELFETRAEALHPALRRLGPDLLGPGFAAGGATEAVRRLRDPARAGRAIGEALLDQRALAGIGNVYKSEVLFIERVDPWAAVGGLSTTRRSPG